MQSKSVVFDLFGVLVSEVSPGWLRQHLSEDQAVRVKRAVIGPADAGECTQAKMFETLAAVTGVPAKRIEEEWLELAVANSEMIEYARGIKKLHKLGLLTNCPTPYGRAVLAKHDLLPMFDEIVVSSEVRIAKPDARAYRIILERLECDAINTALIDDNPSNVAAGKATGMFAILYKERRQAQAALDEWLSASTQWRA
ncbi:MAG: Phosphoglycolate phosphatase [Planctomycetes bacterium]|nr:Phosphoglycolate phosphatase [Planctomycetota bacterium]